MARSTGISSKSSMCVSTTRRHGSPLAGRRKGGVMAEGTAKNNSPSGQICCSATAGLRVYPDTAGNHSLTNRWDACGTAARSRHGTGPPRKGFIPAAERELPRASQTDGTHCASAGGDHVPVVLVEIGPEIGSLSALGSPGSPFPNVVRLRQHQPGGCPHDPRDDRAKVLQRRLPLGRARRQQRHRAAERRAGLCQ